MSRSTFLIAGLFGSFAVSCFALVLAPQAQLGGLQPRFTEEDGKISDIYPVNQNGIAEQGRRIYAREGCVYCHTQQVRDPQIGLDIERGWGTRRSVARDYLYDSPPFLGTTRLGPDLANVGSADWKNESKGAAAPVKRDARWHLHHLYSPRALVSETNHPPYRYLFQKRKISGQRSAEALDLTGKDAPAAGMEVVPTAEAEALVGYLLSLDRNAELPEAKALPVAGATAAPAPAAAPAQPAAAQ